MSEIVAAVDWQTPPEGLDAIAADLAAMREAAGKPSFAALARAIAELRAARGAPVSEQRVARSTLYDCFRSGRRRLDYDVVLEIAVGLGLPAGHHRAWAARVSSAQARADGAAVALVQERAPEPVSYFSGNRAVVQAIVDGLLEQPGQVWVAGMPGSGKSQLAFRAAERLRERGVGALFLDLRGYHAQLPPVEPVAAQRAILRTLGLPDSDGHSRTGDVVAALRDSGNVLILDDAVDPAHAAAVVGGEPGCPVLVTSRVHHAPAGWELVNSTPMTPVEVEELLGHFADARAHSNAAVERLTVLAEGLPLALSLVAGRLQSHPHWSLEEQVDYLAQRLGSARLDTELTVSLRLSYDMLSTEAALMLRHFADLPVAEFDLAAAAISAGLSAARAEAGLAELVSNGLVVAREGDRIALHSVVRSFARAEALENDPPTLRDRAFARLTTHMAEQVWRAYTHIARSMDDVPRRTTFSYPTDPWEVEEASAWLNANVADILALAHAAPERGMPELQWRISEGLSLWMAIVGHVEQALLLHEAAAASAAHHKDHNALAMASLDAGQLLVQLDQPERALAHFQRATRLSRSTDSLADPGLRGLLLNMSGLVDLRYGRLHEAQRALEESVQIHEHLGEEARLMSALVNLGLVFNAKGAYDAERQTWERGLRLARAKDNTMMLATFLINRSRAHAREGDAAGALADAVAALGAARRINFAYLEATALSSAADAHRLRGAHEDAHSAVEAALQIARELGATIAISEILVVAADVAVSAGDAEAAEQRLGEAESLLPIDRDPILRGQILKRRGDLAASGQERDTWWRQAAELFGESESTEARAVRAAVRAPQAEPSED